jgi:predicted phosphoribosyltransferase
MSFRNREEAAHQLAGRLSAYRSLNPVVLGIPRGGVPMARVVADELGGELDVVLVGKIGAPENPACAIGAVDETGTISLLDAGRRAELRAYVEAETARQLEIIHRRRQLYTPSRVPVALANRLVIVVDDGVATGATMVAAVRAVRRQSPRRLVVAVPVAVPGSLALIRHEVDEVICLLAPVPLAAISGYYEDFAAVSDQQVSAALARAAGQPATPAQ